MIIKHQLIDKDNLLHQHINSYHIMHVLVMDSCPTLPCLQLQEAFPDFFKRVLTLKDERELKMHQRIAYMVFTINVFQVGTAECCADLMHWVSIV